jgi:hypothetical protein
MLRIHCAGHRQARMPKGRYFHNRRQAKRSRRKVWQPAVRCLIRQDVAVDTETVLPFRQPPYVRVFRRRSATCGYENNVLRTWACRYGICCSA